MDDVLTTARGLLAARHYKHALRLLASSGLSGVEHDRLTGAAELGRRDHAAALRHLRRALAQAPEDLETLFHLGHATLAAGDRLHAVRLFERVAAASPGFPGLREALAGAYRRDALYHEALRVTDEALAAGNRGADILYERALSLAHLGDAAGALATHDERLADDPEHAAAWFGSHAAALDLHGTDDALRRLRRAAECPGAAGKYWGFLCAYLRLLGRDSEADALFDAKVAGHSKRLPLVEAVATLRPHMAASARLFGVGANLLRHALDLATLSGLVLEFGVRRGTSINQIAEAVPDDTVHGFDSFEGLPEAWVNEPQGVLSTGKQLPPVPSNVVLHAGWFEDTLPHFLAAHGGPVRFVNVDSDIYSSAKTVLTALAPRFRVGTVLVFDEFIGNRTWRDDEYKAFHEYAKEHRASFEVVAVNLFTKQVAIRLTGIGKAG
ncbi:class I SAM-dependent methyltransferase [Azospirillum canadense]|uniref:class I SAM-dependent methyltransferase n=1 Tax=Azospirillum canadense TaxID=403962 RepID=UPI002226AFFB|nr:class I SAM-dependent methyltransferase [Azospirillum canadense]MCW2243990.1 tetratricopeptide (TPR) repeat protein [Azospirillum canadense]